MGGALARLHRQSQTRQRKGNLESTGLAAQVQEGTNVCLFDNRDIRPQIACLLTAWLRVSLGASPCAGQGTVSFCLMSTELPLLFWA